MAEVTPEVVTSEPVAAPEATPTPDSTAEQEVVTPEGDKPEAAPEKLLPQSEVDKLIAKTRAQESRRLEKRLREQVRAEVERDTYKQQLEDRNRPQPQNGAPKLEDFKGDYEKYVIEKAKFELRQELSQQSRETDEQQKAREAQRAQAERSRALNERLDQVAEEIPDVRELLQDDSLPFTEPMVAALLELETGGKVAGYLATHRDEAAKIAKLSPVNQVIEYYELGKKLTAAPRPTQTPPPIVPNSGRTPVEKRLEETTSQEEFNAIRRKQIAARQGRWK